MNKNMASDEAIRYYDQFAESLDVEDLNLCLVELKKQITQTNNIKERFEIVKYMLIVKEIRDEFIKYELI